MSTRSDEVPPAIARARQIIHDNDVDALRALIRDHPELLAWRGHAIDGAGERYGDGVLAFATGAYGDVFDAPREKDFTRAACAEALIDAGVLIMPSVYEGLLDSRARGLLELFQRKGLLPATLAFAAARGDLEAVRRSAPHDAAAINEAFLIACVFDHPDAAALLLARCVHSDPALGERVAGSGGAGVFIKSILEHRSQYFSRRAPAWDVFCGQQLHRALHEDDVNGLVRGIDRAPWLLDDSHVDFQRSLVEQAAFHGRGDHIRALWDRNPALLRQHPPPPTRAFEHAMTYAHTHVVPELTRVWPMPDDLPHHAAMGHLPRVRELLDRPGAARQRGLDVALAYAVINRHFDVADLLLERGADINTRWNSHEPASILHHLVFLPDPHERMQYLIDRGIDMTIEDYRWRATAEGWARYGNNDPAMAEWLRSRLYTK